MNRVRESQDFLYKWKNIFILRFCCNKSMKLLAILVMFVIFLAPITSFAQVPFNKIIVEPVPDSTNIAVTIEGGLDGELLRLRVSGNFGTDSEESKWSSTTLTEDNPSFVFELDYPFLPNEVYTLSARNGVGGKSIAWIPHLTTQETSTKTSEELSLVLGQIQSTSLLVTTEDAGVFVSLRDENKLLSQEIEKKDAVMMEQVKVIKDLAAKISNVKFTKSVEMVSLMAANAESTDSQETFKGYLQTLDEENKLLSQEIEKKDAVILEQLKVIQDLAEKVKNVTFEATSSNFSLV